MNPAQDRPASSDRTAQSVFRAMAAMAPSSLSDCVRYLVERSDFDALQAALESGVIQEVAQKASSSSANRSTIASLAAAIAPLALQASSNPRAKQMMTDWSAATGIESKGDLSGRLCYARDPDSAKALMALGADPIAPAPDMPKDGDWTPGTTVLGYLLRSQMRELMETPREVLRHLAAQDKLPIVGRGASNNDETIFDWLLNSPSCEDHFGVNNLLGSLFRDGIPESWALEAGQAILRCIEKDRLFDNDPGRRSLEVHVIALADFDSPEDLQRVLGWGEYDMAVPEILANPNWGNGAGFSPPDDEMVLALSLRVAGKISKAGLHPDQICTPERGGMASTWLHSAVKYGNVPLTKTLLEIGADPNIGSPLYARDGTRSIIGSETAFDIADHLTAGDTRTEIRAVLAAWRAQTAIQDVVARQKRSNGSISTPE